MSHSAADHPSRGDRDVAMAYYAVQPGKWTFECAKLRTWCEAQLRGRVLNVCAGPTRLAHDGEVVTNDLDESLAVDHHHDARAIGDHFGAEFDTVVFDPPFSHYQATTTYEGETTGYDTAIKRELASVLRGDGRVVQFGYTTSGMPRSLGFDTTAVAVFNTLGRQHDILGSVHDRINHDLARWSK